MKRMSDVWSKTSELTQPPRPRGLPPTTEQASLEASTRNPVVIAAQFDEGAARSQIDVVRGALLKGQSLGDVWRELLALLAFVCVVTALAMARYRRTLD